MVYTPPGLAPRCADAAACGCLKAPDFWVLVGGFNYHKKETLLFTVTVDLQYGN